MCPLTIFGRCWWWLQNSCKFSMFLFIYSFIWYVFVEVSVYSKHAHSETIHFVSRHCRSIFGESLPFRLLDSHKSNAIKHTVYSTVYSSRLSANTVRNVYTVHRKVYGMCTYARTISSVAYHSHWTKMYTLYHWQHTTRLQCTYNYNAYTHTNTHWHFSCTLTKSIEVFLSEFTWKQHQLHCETPAHDLVRMFSCNLIEFLFDFTQFFHLKRMI